MYYLFIVFIHMLNAMLVFLLLSYLLSKWNALLCALFFVSNASLTGWFGTIDTLQNQMALFFALLCFLLIKKILYDSKNNILFYFLLGLTYLMCLLTRETFIVMPVIFTLFIPLANKFLPTKKLFKKSFAILSIISTSILIYLSMRLITYPIVINQGSASTASTFLNTCIISNICGKISFFLYDVYCNVIVPLFINYKVYLFCEEHNLLLFYKLFKNIIVALLIFLTCLNTHKLFFFFSVICITLIAWPIFISGFGVVRYYYDFLPFAAATLGILIQFNRFSNSKMFNLIKTTILLFLILISMITIALVQNKRAPQWSELKTGMSELKSKYTNEMNNSTLLAINMRRFITLQLNLGIAEAFQLNFSANPHTKAVLHFLQTYPENAILENDLIITTNLKESYVQLKSINKNNLWFTIDYTLLDEKLLGHIESDSTEPKPNPGIGTKKEFLPLIIKDFIDEIKIIESDKDKIYDLKITIKKECLTAKAILLSWNTENKNFVVIKSL